MAGRPLLPRQHASQLLLPAWTCTAGGRCLVTAERARADCARYLGLQRGRQRFEQPQHAGASSTRAPELVNHRAPARGADGLHACLARVAAAGGSANSRAAAVCAAAGPQRGSLQAQTVWLLCNPGSHAGRRQRGHLLGHAHDGPLPARPPLPLEPPARQAEGLCGRAGADRCAQCLKGWDGGGWVCGQFDRSCVARTPSMLAGASVRDSDVIGPSACARRAGHR
mmetsp:Transcript_932/g.2773  ORF Transcript_932/g.2773 Transcript_932/m.2773 type:complete len:225 (-) Transcript_932:30-704(-)